MSKNITRIGIGGPVGSGKTAIVEAITPRFLDLGIKVLIITNDVVTTEDAKHVQRTLKGVLLQERILGVETGACPHTAVREDPSMNLAAVEDMERRFPDTDVVLIESGGDNLTLTFSPALVDYFIYVIDVAAGDKIPRKNGPGITYSDILVINKTDLAPHVGASLEVMKQDFTDDARQQAVPVHELQDGRRYSGIGRADRAGVSVRYQPARTAFSMIPAAFPPWARAEALGASMPEFASFQDEPPQMSSGTVGKTGFLRLGFEHRSGKTILANLERRAPYMVQRALHCDEQMPGLAYVFLITTTGCLLQGDRLALDITLRPRAQAHVTSQSATKIHAMDANYAAQSQTITLADDAYLEFLPDPVIPHRHARFISDTQISVAPSATLLLSEIIQPGRKHHHPDECFGATVLSISTAAARPDGRSLFAEKLVIEPRRYAMRQTGVMDSFDVFANVILCAPKDKADRIHERAGADMDLAEGVAFGACRLPNDAGLIFKVLGRETAQVKAKVREFWSVVRQEIIGAALPPPYLWR